MTKAFKMNLEGMSVSVLCLKDAISVFVHVSTRNRMNDPEKTAVISTLPLTDAQSSQKVCKLRRGREKATFLVRFKANSERAAHKMPKETVSSSQSLDPEPFIFIFVGE